jgi:glycosyltransferase involved in cell wall biosynthesis
MKLLVFAHTPPPHHGQSYMVKMMLEGFGGDRRKKQPQIERGVSSRKNPGLSEQDGVPSNYAGIECYHVNTRFSEDIGDMGALRLGKFFLVFRYCFEAIWCRFRFGVQTFFFCPAPPKRPALYRDWLVMLICRPFFRDFIHCWHAAGLADWLQREGSSIERLMTRLLLGKPSLGVALAVANLPDPLWLESRQVAVVPNGIEDPFPDFIRRVLPRRQGRREARQRLLSGEPLSRVLNGFTGDDPNVFRLLFLAHCFRGKGIFETVEGVAIARRELEANGNPLGIHLTVAGEFSSPEDRAEFARRISSSDLAGIVTLAGFVEGTEKRRLLLESDCLCFPTYYHLESFGIVVIEAMAAGMNVITTPWRALPEIVPADYPGFVAAQDAQAIAGRIPLLFTEDGTRLRTVFLERFTQDCHLRGLHKALISTQRPGTGHDVLLESPVAADSPR